MSHHDVAGRVCAVARARIKAELEPSLKMDQSMGADNPLASQGETPLRLKEGVRALLKKVGYGCTGG